MFRKLKFQTKLFLYYSMVLAIIIAIALSVFYLYISKNLEERYEQNLSQIAAKTSGQIDSLLSEMDRIALYVVSNPIIREAFSGAGRINGHGIFRNDGVEDKSKLIGTLMSINMPSSTSTIRTSLYNAHGDYISMGIPDSPDVTEQKTSSIDFTKWYDGILTNKDSKTLLFPHVDFWSKDRDLILVSLMREIKNFNTYATYGIVEVQRPYSEFEQILRMENLSNIKVCLLTEEGNAVYPLDQNNDKEIFNQYLKSISGKKQLNIKATNPITGKVEIISMVRSPFSKWTLIMSETEESLMVPIRLIGTIVLLSGLGMLVVTLSVVLLITKQLTKPLRHLRNSIKAVSLDNLSLEIAHPDISDEIVQLNEAFDAMFKRLKESMSKLVQTRSQEMKAHMIALQSQMDPHFLYNMLSIISASSREAGAFKTTEICQKLSCMLRYITSYQEDFTPIKDEIGNAKNYLELMKLRFENQFNYHIFIDEEVYQSKIAIPKLTLQPLIENCFNHGFKKVLPPWHLSIKAECTEKTWFIEVSDNGIGFPDDKIRQLHQKADEFTNNLSANIKDLKIGGMGLINTLVRLKLLYKDEMVFSIENGPEGGTKITIGGTV